MTNYQVRLAGQAKFSLDRICDYIRYDCASPQAADHQYDRIIQAISRLEHMPAIYRLLQGERAERHQLRRMNVDNFCVLFQIVDDTVFVLDIAYNMSDIDGLIASYPDSLFEN